jgi:CheY-like chemotaxis protein
MHPHSARSPHILVINDAAELLALFTDLLAGEGYTVSCLNSASTSLDAVCTECPDLIIMDYLWSTSGPNWTLLQEIRSDLRTRGIPVLLCPGAIRQAEPISEQLEAMCVLFARKPFDIEELLQMVSSALPARHRRNESHGAGPSAFVQTPTTTQQHPG